MEAASVTQHTGGDIAKNRAREVRSLMSLPNEVLDQIVEFSGTPLTELESLDERSYSGLKNLALVNRFFREMCQRRHLRHIRLSVFQEKLGTKLEEIMREHPESVRNAKSLSIRLFGRYTYGSPTSLIGRFDYGPLTWHALPPSAVEVDMDGLQRRIHHGMAMLRRMMDMANLVELRLITREDEGLSNKFLESELLGLTFPTVKSLWLSSSPTGINYIPTVVRSFPNVEALKVNFWTGATPRRPGRDLFSAFADRTLQNLRVFSACRGPVGTEYFEAIDECYDRFQSVEEFFLYERGKRFRQDSGGDQPHGLLGLKEDCARTLKKLPLLKRLVIWQREYAGGVYLGKFNWSQWIRIDVHDAKAMSPVETARFYFSRLPNLEEICVGYGLGLSAAIFSPEWTTDAEGNPQLGGVRLLKSYSLKPSMYECEAIRTDKFNRTWRFQTHRSGPLKYPLLSGRYLVRPDDERIPWDNIAWGRYDGHGKFDADHYRMTFWDVEWREMVRRRWGK